MEFFGLILLVIFIGAFISNWGAEDKRNKEKKRMKKLKRHDPEKWMRLQEIEHERQMMEHDRQILEQQKKVQGRADFEKGLKIGKSIFDVFFKK